jgi:curved DNA-binding protein CbpA
MAPDVDPFLTLGVPSGASLNEIKSAYRRLVKQYHPDTAGERALPRFLAIQSAYERLVDGEGRLRAAGGDPWRGGTGAAGSRPRASRDAWRARRSTSSSGSGTAGTRSHHGPGRTGARPGAGSGQPDPGESRPGERTRHRRGPRTATPGSTTYDEAAEIGRDPEWDGGAWYGPSMGTFWTINPREYADPRKHGPEYLARARRGTGAAAEPEPGPAGAAAGTEADPTDGDWAWSGRAETTTGGDTADWAARSWTYDTRDPGPTWTADRGAPSGRARRAWTSPAEDASPLPDLETLLRKASPSNLLDRARRSRGWRLLLALVALPPIAYLVSTLVLDTTGCSSYSAACPDQIRVPLMLAQLLVLVVLYAVPVLAAGAAFASIAAFTVAVPVAAILSPGVGPRAPVTSVILNGAFVAAYVAGLAFAAWRLADRQRPADPAP